MQVFHSPLYEHKTCSILNMKIHIFNITGVTQQHCAYIDLYTREYGAVFSRHSLQDRRHQFVVMATFRVQISACEGPTSDS